MQAWQASILAAAWLGSFFWIAAWADRSGVHARLERWRPVIYALSLAVYCTSWTFYGAVGSAATDGWDYLPIYLGPMLALGLGAGVMQRIANAARSENVTSISDFLAARYDRSRGFAALVTFVAVIGSTPYIALQLKSVGMAYDRLVAGSGLQAAPSEATVLAIALALGVFAMAFGIRKPDASGRNQALVTTIAVESLFKLFAFLLVSLFAASLLLGFDSDVARAAIAETVTHFAPADIDARFWTILFLSACAIICLPRQFHIGIVECRDPADIRTARWLTPMYFALFAAAVLPIVAAGNAALPPGSAPPDRWVLDLPLAAGRVDLALLAFLGGASAAATMIVAASVTLSTMICNDLVLPAAMRLRLIDPARRGDMAGLLISIRRGVVLVLMLLAFAYFVAVDKKASLAAIGLVSFAAAAQFAPSLLGALYWRRATRLGAAMGLAVGFVVWAWTLFLPPFIGPDAPLFAAATVLTNGLLAPTALFGLAGPDPLTHGVVWSLGLNTALLVGLSLVARGPLAERVRASAFSAANAPAVSRSRRDLHELLARFMGEADASRTLAVAGGPQAGARWGSEPVLAREAQAAERALSGVIGASSARVVMATALSGGRLSVEDALLLLDARGEAARFSRGVLQGTLENITQGVSVVDADLNLVAWNSAYRDLFDLPPGLLQVGRPVEEVIAHIGRSNGLAGADLESHVARRVAAIRQRRPYVAERLRPNGTVLKTLGSPMPDGGYVTSYTDITEEKRVQDALARANSELERRVEERTAALASVAAELRREADLNRRMADELHRAKGVAEAANRSKTRFLAAASHDLQQPLNAARLFAAALDDATRDADPPTRDLVANVDRAIASSDQLLRALLDISRLDAGGVAPSLQPVALDRMLGDLAREFAPLATARGLRLDVVPCSLLVMSDPGLLRSVVQNFIANAVRYTSQGRILVGCRRRGGSARIEVWDTGPGIAPEQQRAVFEEFRRLAPVKGGEAGAGLGLAIVDRIARLLDHPVTLQSIPGQGSVFAVAAPLTQFRAAAPVPAPVSAGPLDGLSVLCVDNDPMILTAMEATLGRWGCRVRRAASVSEVAAAAASGPIDAALVDHQLDGGETGFDAIARLEAVLGRRPPGAFISADPDANLADRARDMGWPVLRKPVEPAALRAWLSRVARTEKAAG
jgi:Na+/proline symporter/CheY-like chemotaxis protein/anti-sigma regulatory factor (Ser/Thr protein kinase)